MKSSKMNVVRQLGCCRMTFDSHLEPMGIRLALEQALRTIL
jgi:hypothetical protein